MFDRFRHRNGNPFANQNGQNDPDAAATQAHATTLFGPAVAREAGQIIDAAPGLLDRTLSRVRPEDVRASRLTLIAYVVDTSWSAREYLAIQARAHDEFMDALVPALYEDVAILVTCSFLNGDVHYPLTKLEDVPRFGKKSWRDGDELTYDHVQAQLNRHMIDHSPIRDRTAEQIAALLAEMTDWANPRLGRTVQMISMGSFDGFSNSCRTTMEALSTTTGELDQGGSFTQMGFLIGDLTSAKFRDDLIRSIILNFVPYEERKLVRREDWVEKFGDCLPPGWEKMSTEQLARWFQFEQGLASSPDKLLLPGTDPKAIRQVTGQLSRTAFQVSATGFAAPPAFERQEPAAEVPVYPPVTGTPPMYSEPETDGGSFPE